MSQNCLTCNKGLVGKQTKYCSYKCKSNSLSNYKTQLERGLIRKKEAIEQRGGKCSKCGYSKNIAALSFHHIDPSTKSFGLDMRHFSNNGQENLDNELAKCILVCMNCHAEIHYPHLEFKNNQT